jgi:hypothetical protein
MLSAFTRGNLVLPTFSRRRAISPLSYQLKGKTLEIYVLNSVGSDTFIA